MITLLHHARTNGYVCDRIARVSNGHIQSVSDKSPVAEVEGTLIRWDSRLAVQAGKTINTAEAVTLSRNKCDSRAALEGLCPETWFRIQDVTLPCILRPKRHCAAERFHVCRTPAELRLAARRYQRWYASPIIRKTHEYRVFVFQDHVVKIVRRYHSNPEELAWNAGNGGSSKRVLRTSWPIDVAKIAIEAGRRLGLSWYAADVIKDTERSYVLELNTAPGLCRAETIQLLADLFSSDLKPKACKLGETWKSLIHPAL